MSDFYKTLKGVSQGIYKEKMSKFIAIAQPAQSADEAKALIKQIANKYHDARHCCWAYMVGTKRNEYLSSDNGEPSGTAGYFGGIKLGTSGLIVAYREAARAAIEAGEILECHEQATLSFTFPYLAMNDVMKLVKAGELKVLSQQFDNVCSMTIETDADKLPPLRDRIEAIDGVTVNE